MYPLEGATTHSHGPEGAHEHTGWAFTTWIDPQLTIAGLHGPGVGSLLFDPCANTPDSGHFMTVMKANAGWLETIAETSSDQGSLPEALSGTRIR